MNKVLLKLLQIILTAVMITPIVFYRYFYYPFVTGKVLVFRILVFLALIVFGIYVFKVKRIKYIVSSIWWAVLAWVGVFLISAIAGINFSKSFWSNIERAEGVLFIFYLFIFFALLVFAMRQDRHWRWLFRISLITSVMIVGYGLLQYFGLFEAISTTGVRISSTLGNPAYLGSYLLINVFLASYLFIGDRNLYWRIFYGLSLLVNIWVIFLTQTRGSVVGLIAGLGLSTALVVVRNKSKKLKIWAGSSLLLLIICSSLVFVLKDGKLVNSNETLKRVSSISLDSYTVQTRLAAWGASVEAFKEKPILGWGVENYGYAFSKYFPEEIYVAGDSRVWFDKAHSVFFEYLVTTGILGILVYFGLFGLLIYYLLTSKSFEKLEVNILIGLLVGYGIANMFVFDTLATYILITAVLAMINNKTKIENEREVNFENWGLVGLGLVILLFIYWSYIINVQAISDNKKMLMAEAYTRENEVITAFEYYNQALEDNDIFTRYEIARALAIFTRAKASDLPDYQAGPMYERAIEEMQKSIEFDPEEIRHYYNLSQLYLNSYKYDVTRLDKVIDLAPKTIELAPTRAHTYYQIGEAYVNKKEYDLALKNFQIAVDLNPNVIEGYINIYATALLKSDIELANKTKQRMLEIDPSYFEKEFILLKFISLYKKVGMQEEFVSSMEKLIQFQPDKIEYYSTLAIFWAEKGENKKAEIVISSLLGRSEELDGQVEEFVNKIYAGDFLK